MVPFIVEGEPIWCETSPTFGEDTSGPLCGGPVDSVGGSDRTGWKWKVGLERGDWRNWGVIMRAGK